MKRERVFMDRPGMTEITGAVEEEIRRSGKTEGVCVITVLDDRAAVMVTSAEKAAVRQDILEDLEAMFPPRMNYRMADLPWEAAARIKSAVTGGSLDLILHEGRPLLAPGQGIFLADYMGTGELCFTVKCC